MNQLLRSEIIIGLIATAKSRISGIIFEEKKKKNPKYEFINNQLEKMKNLDEMLDDFYKKNEITEDEYEEIIQKLKLFK